MCDVSRKRREKTKCPWISRGYNPAACKTITGPGRDNPQSKLLARQLTFQAKAQGQSQSCSLRGRRSGSADLFVNAGSCLIHVSPRQGSSHQPFGLARHSLRLKLLHLLPKGCDRSHGVSTGRPFVICRGAVMSRFAGLGMKPILCARCAIRLGLELPGSRRAWCGAIVFPFQIGEMRE